MKRWNKLQYFLFKKQKNHLQNGEDGCESTLLIPASLRFNSWKSKIIIFYERIDLRKNNKPLSQHFFTNKNNLNSLHHNSLGLPWAEPFCFYRRSTSITISHLLFYEEQRSRTFHNEKWNKIQANFQIFPLVVSHHAVQSNKKLAYHISSFGCSPTLCIGICLREQLIIVVLTKRINFSNSQKRHLKN